jgi:hypothetical protein
MVMGISFVDSREKMNAADGWFITDSWQRCDFDSIESCDAVAFGPECDAARLG